MRLYSTGLMVITLLAFGACSNDPGMDEITFEQQKVDFYRDFEKAQESKQVEGYEHGKVAEGFFPNPQGLELRHSLMYYRPDASLLPLKSKYYFTPKDSLVQFIVYEWNIATPDMDAAEMDESMATSMKYHEEYVAKYNQVADFLYEKFGEPVEGDKGLKKEQFQNIERWHNEIRWEHGKKRVILSFSLIPEISYRVFCKTYWEE